MNLAPRFWRRRQARRAGLLYVPLLWRSLFEGDTMPPAPPQPSALLQAADEIERDAHRRRDEFGSAFATVDAFRHDVATWLREVAARVPEPYRFREHFAPWPEEPPSCEFIREMHARAGLCVAVSPKLDEYEMPYICTQPAEHVDVGTVHLAGGPDGEVYDSWPT